jgi:hypothetical protein
MTVTDVPGIPMSGEKLVTVGAPVPAVTVKGAVLDALPRGVVTAMTRQ